MFYETVNRIITNDLHFKIELQNLTNGSMQRTQLIFSTLLFLFSH